MAADIPSHHDSASSPGLDTSSVPEGFASDSGRHHWLRAELVGQSTTALGCSPLSPSVIDIDGEMDFWRRHHQRTATWHRNVLPFVEYVPAFTLGISLFLQCHDHVLEALNEQMLAVRYARVRRNSRVEWHEARQAVRAAYLRLQSHWETLPARLVSADASPAVLPLRPRPRNANGTDTRRGPERHGPQSLS